MLIIEVDFLDDQQKPYEYEFCYTIVSKRFWEFEMTGAKQKSTQAALQTPAENCMHGSITLTRLRQ